MEIPEKALVRHNTVVKLPKIEIKYVLNKGWTILVEDESRSNVMFPIMTNRKYLSNNVRYWDTLREAIAYLEYIGLNSNYNG